MTRQPTTGALPGTSLIAHQTTRRQIPGRFASALRSGDSSQAGRPAAEHGGAGEYPPPRRALFNDLPRRLITVVIGDWAWQS